MRVTNALIVMAGAELDDVAAQTMGEVCALGMQCKFVVADITNVDARFDTTDKVFAAFGKVKTLVNNAGVQVKVRGDLLDVTPESYDRVMDINLRGTFFDASNGHANDGAVQHIQTAAPQHHHHIKL